MTYHFSALLSYYCYYIHRSGLISVGDEVIEVNGIPVEGKSPNDVLQILVRGLCFLCVIHILHTT